MARPISEKVLLEFTNRISEARRFRDRGYEPIECAFGEGSVLGELEMDHHGEESWREGVALRACRDHYAARKDDPRFVVTGTPDADAVLSIIALAALVEAHHIPEGFPDLVNRRDLDPIGIDLLDEEHGELLLAFQQTESLRRDRNSFYRAIKAMCRLLEEGISQAEGARVRQREQRRIDLANQCVLEQEHPDILMVESNVWGFDQWYKRAPIVVSFSRRHRSITIGAVGLQEAQELFGERGLLEVFDALGPGWGGRETIGGSPRGETFSVDEAREVARDIEQWVLTDAKGS